MSYCTSEMFHMMKRWENNEYNINSYGPELFKKGLFSFLHHFSTGIVLVVENLAQGKERSIILAIPCHDFWYIGASAVMLVI